MQSSSRRCHLGNCATQDILPDISVNHDVQEIVKFATQQQVHLVHVGKSVDPTAIPAEAQAVLIFADTSQSGEAAAIRAVHELTQQSDAPSIIVMLLQNQESEPTQKQSSFVAMSIRLIEAGADDVFLQPMCVEDFPVVLAMSVAKAQRHYQQIMSYEEQISKDLDKHNRLFWRAAHLIFNNFPALEMSTEESSGRVGSRLFVKNLGHGSAGQVYQSVHQVSHAIEAVKVLPKQDVKDIKMAGAIWRECRALRKFDHPNIVKLNQVIHAPQHIYICMQLAGPENLSKRIRSSGGMKVPQAQFVFSQIAQAVAHVHKLGYAHRDIKPENIAIDQSDHVTLLDFGLVVEVSQKRDGYEDRCGTMPFVAPEVLLGRGYAPESADIWSLGMVLLEMLRGFNSVCKLLGWKDMEFSPKHGEDLQRFFGDAGNVTQACLASFGDQSLASLVLTMLDTAVAQRASATDVLAHPWLATPLDSPAQSAQRKLSKRAFDSCPAKYSQGQPLGL